MTRQPNTPIGGHPSAETLAAYLDGTLATADRRETELHLDECPDCRREVAGAAEALTTGSSGSRSAWKPLGWAGLLAAATVAGILLLPLAERDPTPDPLRTATDSGHAATDGLLRSAVARQPAESSTNPPHITLSWSPLGATATYRVTVLDGGGTLLWSTDTGDTAAVVPDSVLADATPPLFWMTDALLPDGTSATTGTVPLEMSPPEP